MLALKPGIRQAKPEYFKDWYSLKLIMSTKSPRKMKEIGQNIKGYKEDEWHKVCTSVMFQGVLEKLVQNSAARELFRQKCHHWRIF